MTRAAVGRGEVSGRRWRHSYMRVRATKQARYDRFCTRLEEVARKAWATRKRGRGRL
jgi:hypothetical protein